MPIESVAEHGFGILDNRLVLVEAYSAELPLSEPAEIALHERIFEQMAGAAVYGDQARRLISHVARTLPPPLTPHAPGKTARRRAMRAIPRNCCSRLGVSRLPSEL